MSQESNPKRLKLSERAVDESDIHQIVQEEPKHNRLTEADCGITYFVNAQRPRFECKLKEKTSDFQVFEITRNGAILRLKDVPKKEDLKREKEEARAQREEQQTAIATQAFDYESRTANELKISLGEPIFDSLKELVSAGSGWQGQGPNNVLPVITDIIDDKEKRTSIHKGVREVFLGSLETQAREDKKMRISYKPARQSGRGGSGRARGANRTAPRDHSTRAEAWPHTGDYTLFTVYKDGRDTMDVVASLCKIMKVVPKTFAFAGTKDRRGCTVQQFTAWRTHIRRLADLNGNGSLRGITLGDFSYTDKALSLGDLKGNRFVLVMRNVQDSTDDEINSSFSLIRDRGFVNYYGLQRFGSSSTGTHEVGIHILRDDFEKACELILSEHAGAWRETQAAKLHWINTKDAASTLSMMPSKCIAEVAILKHIVKSGQKGDWNGAFNSVPRNLRLMYAHAYQSLVWNHVVTQRLQKFGLLPIAGDLVLAESDVHAGDKPIARARPLQQEELQGYSIYDIVLPLPGCDILYPENCIKESYTEFMSQHQLDPDNMVRKTKELSLLGSYRKIISKPIDLEWTIMKYVDEEQQLVATNLDELEGRKIELPAAGPHTAIKLAFQLDSACYATMMLREALASVPHSV